MREKKIIAIVVVVLLLLGLVVLMGSCSGSGDTYYHIPGTDTHKSKTYKPKGWSVPKVTTRKR